MKVVRIVIAALAATASFGVHGQIADFVPAVKSTPSRIKALVVEKTYLYRVYEVAPPVRLDPDAFPATDASAKRPEATLQEQFVAMKTGDYQRFLNTWTVASQADLNARNKANKQDKDFWLAKWHQLLPGKALEVRNFIVYARFVLIQYALVDVRSGAVAGKDTVAFVKENGVWKMTQELAYEPILGNWDNLSGRVQVPPESMIPPLTALPTQR